MSISWPTRTWSRSSTRWSGSRCPPARPGARAWRGRLTCPGPPLPAARRPGAAGPLPRRARAEVAGRHWQPGRLGRAATVHGAAPAPIHPARPDRGRRASPAGAPRRQHGRLRPAAALAKAVAPGGAQPVHAGAARPGGVSAAVGNTYSVAGDKRPGHRGLRTAGLAGTPVWPGRRSAARPGRQHGYGHPAGRRRCRPGRQGGSGRSGRAGRHRGTRTGRPGTRGLYLLRGTGLSVSQAVLTGESSPAGKRAASGPGPDEGGAEAPVARRCGRLAAEDFALLDCPWLCLAGSSVATGAGPGGGGGHRAADLLRRHPPAARPEQAPETCFDRGVKRASWTLIRFMRSASAWSWRSPPRGGQRRRERSCSLVSVAVGLTPEMLPVVVDHPRWPAGPALWPGWA